MPPTSHVLICDDSELIRRMLGSILVRAGWQVATATHGAEALDAVTECKPDLILLDVNLPGALDGLAVATALRAMPDLVKVPIIFVSGNPLQPGDYAHLLPASSLGKPFAPDALLRLIEEQVSATSDPQ